MINDRTLDITLDEGAGLYYTLELTNEEETCDTHPITGEDTNCVVTQVVADLTGATIAGNITDEFGGSILGTFTCGLTTDGSDGLIDISLSEATIQGLANSVRTEASYGNDPRLRFVGYYDIILTTSGESNRLMEGKVIMSLGA